MSINLLPEELRWAHRQLAAKQLLIASGILYCLFFLVTNGIVVLKIYNLEKQRTNWEIVADELERTQDTLLQLKNEINIAQEEKDNLETLLTHAHHRQTEILWVLQKCIPEHLRLKKIFLSEEGWIELQGEANSMEQVGQLVESLGSYENFREVRLISLELDKWLGSNFFYIELLYE